ncbi:MAG: hypothetical protein QM689_01555 [Oscillospiraceae bacterium]
MYAVVDTRDENDGSRTAILKRIGGNEEPQYCVANDVRLKDGHIGFFFIKPFDNLHDAAIEFELQKHIAPLRPVLNRTVSR